MYIHPELYLGFGPEIFLIHLPVKLSVAPLIVTLCLPPPKKPGAEYRQDCLAGGI